MNLVTHWRSTVAAYPDLVAVTDDRFSYTFAEVDRLTDLIALSLVSLVGESESPIGVLLGHDARAVIATLSILKTGRIRFVLDTHLPSHRLAQISERTGAALALAEDVFAPLADELGTFDQVVSLETLLRDAEDSPLTADELAEQVFTELRFGSSRTGADSFEIVFTSGSTGVPKGVLQLHRTFLNDIAGYRETRGITVGDRIAAVLPLSFIAGSVNVLSALFAGASVVMHDPRDTGVSVLVSLLRRGGISALVCTPHLLRGILQALDDDEVLDDLRLVNTLGEAVHGRDVRETLRHLPPGARFVNEVGSSETGAIATFTVRPGDVVRDGALPAGTPFGGKEIRILDPEGERAATGESGDVVVVSDDVCGGYWRSPELDKAKFGVADDGRRLVRQGDLGRIDDHGVLQLLGRGDSGVKVRGYLVEPSEIESALLSIDEIAEAVVIPLVSTDSPPAPTRLIAYIAPTDGLRAPSNAAIRRALRAAVPEYMVPAEIVQLAALPRTERGKVDRKALPDVPPREINMKAMDQKQLAMSTIWQQVLELPELGLEDDFMALGGDSLSAEELLTVVKDHFGVEIASTDIIAFPTLREFTARVLSEKTQRSIASDVVPLNTRAQGTPLFCFAGAGSLALTYLPFSRRFPDNPLYAFQQHGLEHRAVPDRRLEGMAARHLRTILRVHPQGPYRLVGHSFGGLVALEVARQLVDAGHEVESLVILDTYLQHIGGRIGLDESQPEETTARQAHGLRARFLPDGLPPREQIGRHLRGYLAGVIRHSGQRQYDAFFDHATLLSRRYTMRPFAGRVAVVIADQNPTGADTWNGILTGERDVIEMAAEHTSILREPHVGELAEALREFFESSASRTVNPVASASSV